jgi:hypothetical protein
MKSLKVLAIGNSFSNDATFYLEDIAASSKELKLEVGGASLGGCSLERHWNLASLSQQYPDVLPYEFRRSDIMGDGRFNLQQALQAHKWDVVTLQQVSRRSWLPDTFQPYLDNLIEVVKTLAPTAEIMLHQIWSYRQDAIFFIENGLTQESMFEKVRATYAKFGSECGLRVIPSGQAMQNAREAGEPFVYPDHSFSYHAPVYPNLPDQSNSLNAGWGWNINTGDGIPKFGLDPIHCNARGKYLTAAVWFETFGGDIDETTFRPDEIDEADWKFLRKIAKETAE